jgi:hypothetical protein
MFRAAGIRPVIPHGYAEEQPSCAGVPVAFRQPAFASWASCSRQGTGPSSPSAYQHPREACWTLSGFPCSPRVRPGWGWAPSIPRGQRCPRGRECSPAAARRITAATSLSVRCCAPSRAVMLTRHRRGFPYSRPIPNLPLACSPRTERKPLDFPASFAPGRYQPRTSRWGRVTDTDPRSHRRHQSTSNRQTHSPRGTSCRRHFAYPFSIRISRHLVPFALWTAFPSPLMRRYSHDYYGTCVAIGLAPVRRSHVRLCHTY